MLALASAPARAVEAPASIDTRQGRPELLEAAETALAVVIGIVARPTQIDEHGYRASLAVERVLRGDVGGKLGIEVGWEEFGRGSRFANGERVLLALERVPGQTLWVARFPHREGYVIAARFGAFLRNPDPETTDLLGRYLATEPAARRAAPGAALLSQIAARGHPVLAVAAVSRLEILPGLAGRLSAESRAALAQVLADTGRPQELREAILELVAARGLHRLRPAVAALAVAGEPLEAAALAARARLDGGMDVDEVVRLLGRDDGAVRLVAVIHGADAIGDGKLARLLRTDRAAEVRAAAVSALLRRRGLEALDDATPALFDPDGPVRGAAVLQIAALGSEVVPALESLIPGRSAEDLTGVLAALRWSGADGVATLTTLAGDHPDQKVRDLALLTLGRSRSH